MYDPNGSLCFCLHIFITSGHSLVLINLVILERRINSLFPTENTTFPNQFLKNIQTHVHTCKFTLMHLHIHTHIHTYSYTCTFTHVHSHSCTLPYPHTHPTPPHTKYVLANENRKTLWYRFVCKRIDKKCKCDERSSILGFRRVFLFF